MESLSWVSCLKQWPSQYKTCWILLNYINQIPVIWIKSQLKRLIVIHPPCRGHKGVCLKMGFAVFQNPVAKIMAQISILYGYLSYPHFQTHPNIILLVYKVDIPIESSKKPSVYTWKSSSYEPHKNIPIVVKYHLSMVDFASKKICPGDGAISAISPGTCEIAPGFQRRSQGGEAKGDVIGMFLKVCCICIYIYAYLSYIYM